MLFSFTATCKYLGIDSFAYARDLLGRLPMHPAEHLSCFRAAGRRRTEKPACDADGPEAGR